MPEQNCFVIAVMPRIIEQLNDTINELAQDAEPTCWRSAPLERHIRKLYMRTKLPSDLDAKYFFDFLSAYAVRNWDCFCRISYANDSLEFVSDYSHD